MAKSVNPDHRRVNGAAEHAPSVVEFDFEFEVHNYCS